jgi:hypothetical protein
MTWQTYVLDILAALAVAGFLGLFLRACWVQLFGRGRSRSARRLERAERRMEAAAKAYERELRRYTAR